jgi:hypothetical protein
MSVHLQHASQCPATSLVPHWMQMETFWHMHGNRQVRRTKNEGTGRYLASGQSIPEVVVSNQVKHLQGY